MHILSPTMQITSAVVERPRLPGARAVVGRRRLRRAYAFAVGEMNFYVRRPRSATWHAALARLDAQARDPHPPRDASDYAPQARPITARGTWRARQHPP